MKTFSVYSTKLYTVLILSQGFLPLAYSQDPKNPNDPPKGGPAAAAGANSGQDATPPARLVYDQVVADLEELKKLSDLVKKAEEIEASRWEPLKRRNDATKALFKEGSPHNVGFSDNFLKLLISGALNGENLEFDLAKNKIMIGENSSFTLTFPLTREEFSKDLNAKRIQANKIVDLYEDVKEVAKNHPVPELTAEMVKARTTYDEVGKRLRRAVGGDANLQDAILKLNRADRREFESLLAKINTGGPETARVAAIEDFFKPKEGAKVGLTPANLELLKKLGALGLLGLLVDTASAQSAAEKDMKAKTGKNSLPPAGAKTQTPASEAVIDEDRTPGSH